MGYFLSIPTLERTEASLICDLAVNCPQTVRAAVEALWERWHNEAGPVARGTLDCGVALMSEGQLEDAEAVFSNLMRDHPGWAEAINKKATVLYLQGRSEASGDLCAEVVKLKPDHFGAWNGLALCAMQTGEWLLAREAVLQSLRLQPYSAHHRQLLTLVDSRLADC